MRLRDFLTRERPRFKTGFLAFGLLVTAWGAWLGVERGWTISAIPGALMLAGLLTVSAATFMSEAACQKLAIVLLICNGLFALGALLGLG